MDVVFWGRFFVPRRPAGRRVIVVPASDRSITPELLDELDPGDHRAQRSRRDLQRIHRVMRSVSILGRLLDDIQPNPSPRSVVELGGGDGTLLLRLAKNLKPRWPAVQLTILDQHDLVSERTREAYRDIDWHVSVEQCDVRDWARTSPDRDIDLCVTNLFLHHFSDADLSALMLAVASRAHAFISCEPQRDRLGRLGSACVGLIGANFITRTDAVKSVDAGFYGDELTHLWPPWGGWTLQEFRALPFTHCFTAVRTMAQDSQDNHASRR